jgi:hypothetical protein
LTNTVNFQTDLRSESEIVLAAQFMAAILNGRSAAPAGNPAPTEKAAATHAQYTGPKLVRDAAYADAAKDTAYVAEQVALADPAYAPPEPAVIERDFREFVKKHGTPAARALLDKYDAPYLKDVPPARLAEFLAEVRA